jgi:hypothetical protein
VHLPTFSANPCVNVCQLFYYITSPASRFPQYSGYVRLFQQSLPLFCAV